MTTPGDERDQRFCSYETFGVRFFAHAVTAERIQAAVAGVIGDRIEFGPIAAGPGGMAKVSATGHLRTPETTRTGGDDEPLSFRLVIPVDLALDVRLGGQTHRFDADLELPLRLTARAAEPLLVIIDIEPPAAGDLQVTVHAQSRRAAVLQHLAGIDDELRRFVARYVAREIAKPGVRRATTIDVAARIDDAYR